MDLSLDAPPPGQSVPLQALWWLAKGQFKIGTEWEKAHALCQQDEGNPQHDHAHALAHLIEGDQANAAYWYRRCKENLPKHDLPTEWQRLTDLLSK
jgi:hypothetical protein